MAGTIFWDESSAITLTSSGGALIANGGGVANGTADLDCRTGGNAAEMFVADFELSALQWTTITGVVAGTIVSELYLVPILDGSNLPTLLISNGATDYIPYNHLVGRFTMSFQAVTVTNYRFNLSNVDLLPLLYRPYLINRSGQTYGANWVLKAVTAKGQYT